MSTPGPATPKPPVADDPSSEEPSKAPEPSRRTTYRERKAHSEELAALARTLVEMAPSRLRDVPLPDEVRAEVEICRGFRKGPRVRQLRRVSQLLRRLDLEAVAAAAADAGHRQRRRAQRERIYEHWRQRLLDEGDPALTELLERVPGLDAQPLRQRLRQARRDPQGARGAQARREVLRSIREAMESQEEPAEAESESELESEPES